jgi:hypothetical protein
MNGPRAPRRWLRWLLVPLVLAAPVVAFWAFTEWSSQREVARVRELLAAHAGPAPAAADSEERIANEAAVQLRAIFPAMGLGREGGERLARDDPRRKPTDLVRKAAHHELERVSIEPAPLDVERAAAMESLMPRLAAARELVLAGSGPQWTTARSGLTWVNPDLSDVFALVDLLLADAFERERRGDAASAAADMEAAWVLAASLREHRSLIGTILERAAEVHVAISARRISSLGPEWGPRLDIDPLGVDTLEALRFQGRAFLDPPDWPDVAGVMVERGGEMPILARRFELLMAPTMRRQLARQVEANIPVIEALEDETRCGPASLRSLVGKRSPHVWGVGWLGDIEPDVSQASRLDNARVQLELTRRLLDLRARREADPQHRWPEDLGDDGSSSCPGVAFRLVARGPAVLVLEAESQDGAWWEGSDDTHGYPARVEIPREAEPPAP